MIAQRLHRARDLLHALFAFERIALDALAIEPVGRVDFVQRVGEGHAALGIRNARLRRKHRGANRVLVPREPAREETEALFKPEEECLLSAGLIFVHLFADEPKSRHHVFQRDAIGRRDCIREARGDDALDHHAVFRQALLPAHGRKNVLKQDATDLVARQRHPFVRLGLDRNAEAIRIRVGREANTRALLLRQRNRETKRIRVLRVWRGNGRKMPVRRTLLRHRDHVAEPHAGEQLPHGHRAGAVQRRVDNRQVSATAAHQFRIEQQLRGCGIVRLVLFLAHERDGAGGNRRVIVRHARREHRHTLNLVVDCGGLLGRGLSAVCPIDLIAVVFAGVMGGGDHHARHATQMLHGKRKLRHGVQRRE